MLAFTFEDEGKTWIITPIIRWKQYRNPEDPAVLASEWGVKLQQYCYNEKDPEDGQWFDINTEGYNEP